MGAPSLAIQVLGDELKVEGLPCCTICQPARLLLLAGHDLKKDSNRCAFCLHTPCEACLLYILQPCHCLHATGCSACALCLSQGPTAMYVNANMLV